MTTEPITKEQLESLQAKIQALTAENERLDGGYKGLQRTLEGKNKEIKERADLESRIANIQDTIELLAVAVSANKGELEELEPDERKNILAEVRKRKETQEVQRKTEETKRNQQEYIQKGAAIYAKAEELIGDDVDNLHHIRNLIRAGDYDLAERKIAKLEKAKGEKEKGKTPVETEEQRINRLAEEKFTKLAREKGLLEEYSGLPSAGSGTPQEVMSLFIKGQITAEEAKKRGVKFS